jgi:hypothetical protein
LINVGEFHARSNNPCLVGIAVAKYQSVISEPVMEPTN